MKDIKLSKRLSAAAELCRRGSFICDVGTDHAYLPIYLAKNGMIRGGVVSDINRGPIERAEAHIKEWGMSEILTSVRCDGLFGIESYDPEDIFILGMGGELIARIINDAPFVRDPKKRLILQPMTHPELLRKYLYGNGFDIIDERLVFEDRIYQLLSVEYSGRCQPYNRLELMLGKINLSRREPLLFELAEHTKRVIQARIEGKMRAGIDCKEEKELILEIEKLI